MERGVNKMSETLRQYKNEATGISYSLIGDYYMPDFVINDSERHVIGRFGRERLYYLQNHRKLIYINLLTSGKLNNHLHEIEETAHDRIELITKQIASCEGVTEELKADDMLLWIQKMNNIRNRVIEMIRDELIYY